MIPSLCSHCNGCRLRTMHKVLGPQRSKRKQQQYQRRRRLVSTPHHHLLVVTTSLILSLSLVPHPIHAQQQPQPQPYIYRPRFSSGSAIANNRLYIVSGYISEGFPSDAVGDTIFVPLDRPFSNDSVPWMAVNPPWITPKRFTMNGTDATVVPTLDQSHLILLGASGVGDPFLMSYDIGADSWTPFRWDPVLPRSAVGAALDLQTGVIIVQGGFVRIFGSPLPSDIDILSYKEGMGQWTWAKGVTSTVLNGIFQPVVVYLPTRKATLIIGGTEFANNSIGGLRPFDSGYLVSTSTIDTAILSIAVVNLTASDMEMPSSRLSPCYSVLENGNLFMYGGATFSGGLNEAWILNVVDMTWKKMPIGQNPAVGRVGATCQRISPDHIMVVGGKFTSFAPLPTRMERSMLK